MDRLLGDGVQKDATPFASSGGGIRTPDTRIMIPPATPQNPEENTHSRDCAAPGAAVEWPEGPIDPDLGDVIQRWPNLPEAVRTGILAIVRSIK